MKTQNISSLRRDLETFLCWYAAVYILKMFLVGFGLPYSILQMVQEGGSADSFALVGLTVASRCLPGIVAGVWLWKREYSDYRSRIIWTIFGLVSALWAVGFYLLMLVVTTRASEESVNESADPDRQSN